MLNKSSKCCNFSKVTNKRLINLKEERRDMKNTLTLTIITAILVLISLNLASAIVLDSVSQDSLYPGQTANIKIDIKNNLNDDIEDVSVSLDLSKTLFTTSGSSEDSQDEIKEDDEETFSFDIKAPSNIKPGDYNIPYNVEYTISNGSTEEKSGSFGITVKAKTELSYSIESQNNIIGSKGKLSFKIINSGLGDISFVNVQIISANGLEVLGSGEDYIGTVSSNDFETASFDALYKSSGASIIAVVTYKDFDNQQQQETVTLPVKVYTQEKALELGLITKSKTTMYAIVVIVVLVIWFFYRKWRKAKKDKLKREKQQEA